MLEFLQEAAYGEGLLGLGTSAAELVRHGSQNFAICRQIWGVRQGDPPM